MQIQTVSNRFTAARVFACRFSFLLILLVIFSGCSYTNKCLVYSNFYGAHTEIYPLETCDGEVESTLEVKSSYESWFDQMMFDWTMKSELETSNGQSIVFNDDVSHIASNGKLAVLKKSPWDQIVFVDIESNTIVDKWYYVNKRCREIMGSEFNNDFNLQLLAISNDGKFLATYHKPWLSSVDYSGVVLMWDIDKKEVCEKFFIPPGKDSKPIRSESIDIEFSPDNSVIAYYCVQVENDWDGLYCDPDFRKMKGLVVLWDTAYPDNCTMYSDLTMPKRSNFVKLHPGFFRIIIYRYMHQIDWVKESEKYAVELQADKSVYVSGWVDD